MVVIAAARTRGSKSGDQCPVCRGWPCEHWERHSLGPLADKLSHDLLIALHPICAV
jgi:hypothetical protein